MVLRTVWHAFCAIRGDVGRLVLDPSAKLFSRSWAQSLAGTLLVGQLCACGLSTPEKKGEAAAKPERDQTTGSAGGGQASEESEPSTSGESDFTSETCEDVPGQRCLSQAPPGWHGPVQPQKAEHPDALEPCDVTERALRLDPSTSRLPDAKNNRYVMELSGAPAACEACEVEVELGQCSQATLLRYKVKADAPGQCDEPDGTESELPITATCTAISGSEARSGEYALGVVPGISDRAQAQCRLGPQEQAELDPGEAPHYYRICEAQEREASCSGEKRCMAFENELVAPREGKACIYREGEHECPDGNYLEQRIIFGSYEDTRSCEACELLQEPGEIRCLHELGVSKRDPDVSCANASIFGADTLCLIEENFLGREAPWAIQELSREASWSGSCESSKPAAVGSLEPREPWTLCCAKL